MQTNDRSCFSNILRVIEVLQKNSGDTCCFDNDCSRPFLGALLTTLCYNTRPVTFYTCNGKILSITLNDGTTTSSVFRVEKVEDNCVTLRILVPSPTPTDTSPYESSGEFVTINLECICVIQCLPDVIVENIC